MKNWKAYSIYLFFSLVILAGVEKNCFSLFCQSSKSTDYSANEPKAANSLISHVDIHEENVTDAPVLFSWNVCSVLSERVLKAESFYSSISDSRIWQPPKKV